MCIGIPLERALRQFEKDAELGSNTGSYSLYDYQRFYLKPLFRAIEKTVQNRAVLVCDETPFDCLQDQGRGKIPAAGVEPKAKTNYVVAVTTADGAPQPERCTITARLEAPKISVKSYPITASKPW